MITKYRVMSMSGHSLVVITGLLGLVVTIEEDDCIWWPWAEEVFA